MNEMEGVIRSLLMVLYFDDIVIDLLKSLTTFVSEEIRFIDKRDILYFNPFIIYLLYDNYRSD